MPPRKLNDSELALLAQHYAFSTTPTKEIEKIYKICRPTLRREIRNAIQKGFTTREECEAAKSKRKSEAVKGKSKNLSEESRKKLSEMRSKMDDNMLALMSHHYAYSSATREEIARRYGLCVTTFNNHLRHAIEKGWITKEEIDVAKRRNQSKSRQGKNLSEETIKKLERLDDNEAAILAHHHINTTLPVEEFMERYNICEQTFYNGIDKALQQGWITEEEYKNARARRRKEGYKKAALSRRKLDDNQVALLMHHFANSNTPTRELAKRYGLGKGSITQQYRMLGIKKGYITEEEYERAKRRREIERDKTASEETRERQALAAIKREKTKVKKYHVGDRFQADSTTEGAAALMLEKYVPGYKIEHGKTFQENGDTTCLYDFILEDAILEWHPIDLSKDGRKLLPGDYEAYQAMRKEVKNGQRKALAWHAEQLKNDLAVEYWFRRQDASNKSQVFKGREVFLARDTQELYDFISRYNKDMSAYEDFKREFMGLCSYVRKFERKEQKPIKLEQKAEIIQIGSKLEQAAAGA